MTAVYDAPASITDKITNLSHHAMLVRLNIQQWTARKTDRRLADEAAERTHGDKSQHSHSRKIIAKEALAKIDKIARDARAYHRRNTRPWQYEGVGIVSAVFYLDYAKVMRDYEREFNKEVAIFIPNYPSLIVEARQLLGDTYNIEDYPHPDQIPSRFGFFIHFSKVEMGSDFRVPNIGKEAEQMIQHEINMRANDAIETVLKSVWEEIFEHVNILATRLKSFNEREKAPKDQRKGMSGVLKEAVIDNLRELVERLPRINITGNPEVEAMRVRLMRQLCANDAEDLKNMPLTRDEVLNKAEKILAEVGEFLA